MLSLEQKIRPVLIPEDDCPLKVGGNRWGKEEEGEEEEAVGRKTVL